MATFDKRKLQDLIRNQPALRDRLLDSAAESVVTDVKLSFGTSPDGRRHEVGQGVVHIASRAGYPPNVDTGALRASIRAVKKGNAVRWVQDGVEYGVWLELGTARMAARPFIAPAFRRLAQRWPQFVRQFMERNL